MKGRRKVLSMTQGKHQLERFPKPGYKFWELIQGVFWILLYHLAIITAMTKINVHFVYWLLLCVLLCDLWIIAFQISAYTDAYFSFLSLLIRALAVRYHLLVSSRYNYRWNHFYDLYFEIQNQGKKNTVCCVFDCNVKDLSEYLRSTVSIFELLCPSLEGKEEKRWP